MSALSIPTAAELKRLFSAHGVRPSRVRGQNFLVDARAMRFIADAADLDRGDVVLEPGAGTGGLTGLLSGAAGAVIAVEVDRKLHAIAAERLAPLANVTLIHADILARDGGIAPVVRSAIRDALADTPRFKVVANLPYAVGTAVIDAVLFGRPVPAEMIVTVQREVADRICAKPGTADYGYLSVLVQAVARGERLRKLRPGAFWPRPEVDSALLRIRPDAALRSQAGDLGRLRCMAGALFRHRRKQVARGLALAGMAPDRDAARRLLSTAGVAENARPEEMDVAQFVRLGKAAGSATALS